MPFHRRKNGNFPAQRKFSALATGNGLARVPRNTLKIFHLLCFHLKLASKLHRGKGSKAVTTTCFAFN